MPRGNPDILKTPKPGRPKGSKDKLPKDLKLRFLAVIESLDAKGITLESVANKDPKWFYTNMVKPMLPKDVHIDADLIHEIEIKFIRPDENKR